MILRNDSSFFIRVASVRYVNGQRHSWTNEPLTIRADFVRDVRVRRLSRKRTAITASVLSSALIAFVISRDLFGFGSPGTEPGGGNGGVDQ